MESRTNEDTLKDMLRNLKKEEVLRLLPSTTEPYMIEVYKHPIGLSEQFPYLTETEKEKYWIGALMAIELHKENWIRAT